ncbi:hypothetical protein HHL22_01925 [Hymenobacter sp. RP-2-7]|uniref:Thiamine pyrophosphate enzyme TPP-binding domain-containing protein n=1 Tax=Hymenobacter polaris TaxID=2682546 RepID=A0A7Y0AAW3_9BACT|nr:hypothetical protein [Hymenobacter polaris]
MLLSELLTLRQTQAPVKVIVLNDRSYRHEAQPAAGSELSAPDFARLAEATGLKGLRVRDPAQLAAVLREALAHHGPVVIDAVVRHEKLLPLAADEAWGQG